MNDFLPEWYQAPKTEGGYMKFKKWQNKFRILGKSIVGWEYFTTDNKPKRFPMDQKPEHPTDIKKDDKGNASKVKHFRAFPVYNYQDNAIQLLELTQASIMGTIKEYVENPKWWSPVDYDIIVSKEGEWLDTEYTVTVDPKEPIAKEILEWYFAMWINTEALFAGENPFEKKPF